MSGTNTRTAVLNRLVGNGEFTKVMTNHLGLDFKLVKSFSVVDTNVSTNELRNDDHVAQVGLDNFGLVFRSSAGSSSLLNALDQSHRLLLQATENLATRTSRKKLKQTLAVNLEKLLELYPAVRKLAESSFLLQISNVVNLKC